MIGWYSRFWIFKGYTKLDTYLLRHFVKSEQVQWIYGPRLQFNADEA